ncbi:hypothetical protein CCOS191_1786 [Pseudomonas sp. CCOS 191]|nr:hypothetical protein CCOS191_1786 [Pseudomonas sp. CCOS 191]
MEPTHLWVGFFITWKKACCCKAKQQGPLCAPTARKAHSYSATHDL